MNKIFYGLKHKPSGNLLGLEILCRNGDYDDDNIYLSNYRLSHDNPDIPVWLTPSKENVENVMKYPSTNFHFEYNNPGNPYKVNELEIVIIYTDTERILS